MPRRLTIEDERRARQHVEDIAQRTVGMWWNLRRFEPELAAQVAERGPRLVEALDELSELVMPKGVSLD